MSRTKTKKNNKSTTDKTLFSLLQEHLFFVSLYTFLFFLTINVYFIAISEDQKKSEILSIGASQIVLAAENVELVREPELIDEDFSFPILSAQGVFVKDLDSGKVLFEKTPDSPLLPASTVKLMTALVTIDSVDKNKIISVPQIAVVGQKMGLVEGDLITVDSLTKALLVHSANDAAEVLAETYDGGRVMFVYKMNEKAREIGLQNTLFSNPTGLDGVTQVTTARDLAKLAEYALSDPRIAEIVSQKTVEVTSVDGTRRYRLINTNQLLGKIEGVLGIKTGWTENARENLVTYVNRDDKRIITVILGSQDRFGETEELIEWIYNTYTWY